MRLTAVLVLLLLAGCHEPRGPVGFGTHLDPVMVFAPETPLLPSWSVSAPPGGEAVSLNASWSFAPGPAVVFAPANTPNRDVLLPGGTISAPVPAWARSGVGQRLAVVASELWEWEGYQSTRPPAAASMSHPDDDGCTPNGVSFAAGAVWPDELRGNIPHRVALRTPHELPIGTQVRFDDSVTVGEAGVIPSAQENIISAMKTYGGIVVEHGELFEILGVHAINYDHSVYDALWSGGDRSLPNWSSHLFVVGAICQAAID